MAKEAFKELVKKYADGKPICNCGEAYLTACGVGSIWNEEKQRREDRTDLLTCKAGCSAAQIDAKEYIAERVLQDLASL